MEGILFDSNKKLTIYRKADIWSVGCTVIEMATGKPPWSQYKNQFTALYYIGHAVDPPPYPAELSTTAHQFLDLIFQRNPRKRANVYKLLHHPFITGEDIIDLTAQPKLFSNADRAAIVKQASNKVENYDSIASPQSVKPAIEISENSLDESDYITSGQNQKAHFYVVDKKASESGGTQETNKIEMKKILKKE